jgi:hypothetical protein
VSETGLLEIVAELCGGDIAMSVDYGDSTEGNRGADRMVTRTMDGKIQTDVLNAIGTYYVTLSLLKTLEDSAHFVISYQFYPNYALKPAKIVPGREGLITWRPLDSDTIRVSWTAPEYEDGQMLSDAAGYLVYVTSDTLVKMDSVCAIRAAVSTGKAWVIKSLYSQKTTARVQLQPGHSYLLNVISSVSSASLLLPYTPTEVLLIPPRGLFLPGSIIVLCGVIIGLGLYWRKHRVARNAEVKDVRRHAEDFKGRLEETMTQNEYQTIELT